MLVGTHSKDRPAKPGRVRGGFGYPLADGGYGASRVYEAAAVGYQLVAPPDARDTGGGHRYQSPHRPGWRCSSARIGSASSC